MTSTVTQNALNAEKGGRPAPPFEPDPEIIGNYEGNKRIQESDRQAARDLLDRQRQRDHA